MSPLEAFRPRSARSGARVHLMAGASATCDLVRLERRSPHEHRWNAMMDCLAMEDFLQVQRLSFVDTEFLDSMGVLSWSLPRRMYMYSMSTQTSTEHGNLAGITSQRNPILVLSQATPRHKTSDCRIPGDRNNVPFPSVSSAGSEVHLRVGKFGKLVQTACED